MRKLFHLGEKETQSSPSPRWQQIFVDIFVALELKAHGGTEWLIWISALNGDPGVRKSADVVELVETLKMILDRKAWGCSQSSAQSRRGVTPLPWLCHLGGTENLQVPRIYPPIDKGLKSQVTAWENAQKGEKNKTIEGYFLGEQVFSSILSDEEEQSI